MNWAQKISRILIIPVLLLWLAIVSLGAPPSSAAQQNGVSANNQPNTPKTGVTAQAKPVAPNTVPGVQPPMSPNDMVRKVVDNELKAADDNIHYMYKLRHQDPSGSKTKELVETTEGSVARLIALNEKPLTADQRQQEKTRLERLLAHPEEQQKKKREQQQDADRVKRMFKALPDAFIYEYAGTVPGKFGDLVRLSFRPNPKFDPPSRELSVYRGMEGDMTVDPRVFRLAGIEAHLFRDVTFGWGLLGHLDKGGHFNVQQSPLEATEAGRWEVTLMDVQFTGKALLFKTINLREKETAWDFQRIADNLTLAQGIELLNKQPDVVAQAAPE